MEKDTSVYDRLALMNDESISLCLLFFFVIMFSTLEFHRIIIGYRM